jgi:DNA-binding CsgD family transcriptional regulator
MASSRRAVQSVTNPLDEAEAAWRDGQYERVLRLLGGAPFDRREERVRAAIYQGRAALELDRPDAVAALLERTAKEAKGAEETLLARMVLGAALARTNRREQGDAMLNEAAALAQRSAPEHAADVAYYRALSRLSAQRLGDAEEIVEAALPQAAGVARARLLQVLGQIDVRRENYAAAAHEFTAALGELDKSKSADVKARARVLNALGFIAAETIDLRLGRLVRREYEPIEWSDDTRVERVHVLDYLAWLSLLEGDVARAWDERQLALTLAADTDYHAPALVGAAQLAGIVGDRFSESRYLDLAGTLLLRGDRAGADAARRIAMHSFVAAVPAANAETARKVLASYDRTRPRRTETPAFEADRRLEAHEHSARGKMALAEGRTQQGVAELQQALEAWSQLGYRLRAALVANDLRAVTGDRRYAQTALDALRNTPNAWIRPILERRTTEDDPLGQLTPAERRVLAELCKGKKAREIAAGFDRSFNTINNHTRAIFSAFGVRSRAALVAECARLGILDDIKSLR